MGILGEVTNLGLELRDFVGLLCVSLSEFLAFLLELPLIGCAALTTANTYIMPVFNTILEIFS